MRFDYSDMLINGWMQGTRCMRHLDAETEILSTLLLNRLAAQSNAATRKARTQNMGENNASAKPPATAANPVAFSALMPLSAFASPGPIRANIIPVTTLSTPFT